MTKLINDVIQELTEIRDEEGNIEVIVEREGESPDFSVQDAEALDDGGVPFQTPRVVTIRT